MTELENAAEERCDTCKKRLSDRIHTCHEFMRGARYQAERDAKLCVSPYSDEVQCLAGDEPLAVGIKLAQAIRASVEGEKK